MKTTKHILAALTIIPTFLAASSGYAYYMAWESNDFSGGPGNWILTQNNTANGNNVDWVNSNRAGGAAAGELGGTVARHVDTAFYGRYLDIPVTLNDELWFRGRFSVTNTYQTANNSIYIGYYDTASDNANYIGWRTREPSSGPTGNFRSRARINIGGSGTNRDLDQALGQGVSYTFDLHWVPSGANDGTGQWTIRLGNFGPTTYNYTTPVTSPSFDMFGLWWDESGTDPNIRFEVWFDDLEYLVPVPEPSMVSLLAGGLVFLGWARKGWGRRQ